MNTNLLAEKLTLFCDRLCEGIALVNNSCTGDRYTTVVRSGPFGWTKRVTLGKLKALDPADKLSELLAEFVGFTLKYPDQEYPDEDIREVLQRFCDNLNEIIVLINGFCDGYREVDDLIGQPYLYALSTLFELYYDMCEFNRELCPV